MLKVFEILGINKNATPEDIQLSFAYLYQMIDLIYPLEKDGDAEKNRNEELKKLEFAYLSALKSIRIEVIKSSNANYRKECDAISELDKIEKLLNQNKKKSSQHNISTCNYKDQINRNSKPEELLIKKNRYPIILVNGEYHKILELSELEISIYPTKFYSYGETLKGELKLTPGKSLKIVGKIVRKDKDRVTTKLVTRIAKKWVKDFYTKKNY